MKRKTVGKTITIRGRIRSLDTSNDVCDVLSTLQFQALMKLTKVHGISSKSVLSFTAPRRGPMLSNGGHNIVIDLLLGYADSFGTRLKGHMN
jgi:hypothetical protein